MGKSYPHRRLLLSICSYKYMIYSKESLSPVAGYSWLRKHLFCYNIILYIGIAMVSRLTGRYSVVVGLVSVTRPE